MKPQPTGITSRAKTMVWVAVAVGAAASLAQLLLEWRFDLLAERLVDAHNDTLLRSRVTDSIIIWSTAPTAYYIVRLALWVCALAAAVATAAMAVRGSRGGRIALIVLAAVFIVVNVGYGALYGVFTALRVDEVYGDEIAYPRWMYIGSGIAAELSFAVAVALVVFLATPPFARRKNPVKLGLREGE